MGMSPDDIISALLHLNHAQIHDALSYYYDHKDEIDKQWKETLKEVEALRKKLPSILEKKISKIKDIH